MAELTYVIKGHEGKEAIDINKLHEYQIFEKQSGKKLNEKEVTELIERLRKQLKEPVPCLVKTDGSYLPLNKIKVGDEVLAWVYPKSGGRHTGIPTDAMIMEK
ncbi:hypothetical protein KAS79_02515 [Candidatus Parcubacteria bacterium]|nr:hypothetical protein [Candidatus Parcubacteria bacterium]